MTTTKASGTGTGGAAVSTVNTAGTGTTTNRRNRPARQGQTRAYGRNGRAKRETALQIQGHQDAAFYPGIPREAPPRANADRLGAQSATTVALLVPL